MASLRRRVIARLPRCSRSSIAVAAALVLLAVYSKTAFAVLDVGDGGPVLDAGSFRMRVTNAGIVGNAFFAAGRSFDPSLEFPPHSGFEMLNYAALWVGARKASGEVRVSGGPLLEWRPTLAPEDRVLEARRGRLGSVWLVDDDRDGSIDEETLNGRDDDGDWEIDEDIGLTADQLLACDYVDDTPEAIRFTTGSENHVPLGLSVHQEVMAWGRPGYDDWAAIRFEITNHSTSRLTDVLVGLLVDADSRLREDPVGHLNDRIDPELVLNSQVNEGLGIFTITYDTGDTICCGCGGNVPPPQPCIVDLENSGVVLRDADPDHRAQIAVLPLGHTTDPLAWIPPAAPFARAPARPSFRRMIFSNGRPEGQGGVPITDAGRYSALAGLLPESITQDRAEDFVILVSCGPFPYLDPGQSVVFEVALVVASGSDSLLTAATNAMRHHYGLRLDLMPDIGGRDSTHYDQGRSGLNGHESCISAPPGQSFQWDPHCFSGRKFPGCGFEGALTTYTPDSCIWTDADCDPCTGFGGRETVVHWPDPGAVPPAPNWRATPADHAVVVEWDNSAEVLLKGLQYGTSESTFLGYRLYRIDDWRERTALLPERRQWSIRGAFGTDVLNGAVPLESVLDSTLDYERILFSEELYPVGRYRFVDETARNGFDYVYVLTSVYELAVRGSDGTVVRTMLESPLTASFDERVTPRVESRDDPGGVWVVPNPFRASAGWDRQPVAGDARTKHLDFMGLPRDRSTIKIWTVAGDLVAVIRHDGTNGSGQAAWDLVSRNGQDVESGIYLFTVESKGSIQRGRFVVIR